jgi:adenylosuccinate synthase
LIIAAGSEVNPEILKKEIEELHNAGINVRERLTIDPQVTIIKEDYKRQEAELVGRIGSTGEGIGAARSARIMRTADIFADKNRKSTAEYMIQALRKGANILVEGTQGFGLGLHAGYYPKCTSSDARAIDFLAMAGIPPWVASQLTVWVVLRTYPIRVAGDSGPLMSETTWEALNLPPEHTTVTKKVRRVGGWDSALAKRAVFNNGGSPTVKVALTFYDYVDREIRDGGYERIWHDAAHLRNKEEELQCKIALVGIGPDRILDLRTISLSQVN